MKEVNPLDVLRAYVAQFPTQKAAAAAMDISDVYLSEILREKRLFSELMLGKLGLRRVVILDEREEGRKAKAKCEAKIA